MEQALELNGYRICYNSLTPQQYDPTKQNIACLIESPAMVAHYWDEWIKPDMTFVAEISFHNFFKLPRFYNCRSLYATSDNFVDLDLTEAFTHKTHNTSLIYSERQFLEGHKLRYEAAQRFGDQVDLMGSGAGKFIDKIDSLAPYRFQIVFENGRYPDYISEKFYDCLKTMTVPIYWGGEAGVKEMGFDPRGILFMESLEDLERILREQAHPAYYESVRPYVEANQARLVEIRQHAGLDAVFNLMALNGYFLTTQSYYGAANPEDLSFHL